MGIRAYGTDNYLRLILHRNMQKLKDDDQVNAI